LELSKKAVWPITVVIITSDAKKADTLSAQIEEMNEKDSSAPMADCETIILFGKDQDEIIKFIKEGSVELIVMGAYGHNRLRELFLGSTTSHIIRKSPIPVLLTR
jgi:nucleotide-binding universal stress UspA family protein